jgi:protein ImuB
MLGPECVVTAVPVGGRSPVERVSWVPWGEDDDRTSTGSSGPSGENADEAPWPGAVPGPMPARVFDPPLPARLVDAAGGAVTVSGRGEAPAPPAYLWCDALPEGGGPVVAWAGPWPHDLRWWASHRRRAALWQVVVGTGSVPERKTGSVPERETGVACLVAVTRGRAEVECIYD